MRSSGKCAGVLFRCSLLAAGILVVLAGTLALPRPAHADSHSYQYIETDLTVLDNGTFRVLERQLFQFHGVSVGEGHRKIPTHRVERVDHIAVYEVINGVYIDYAHHERERARTFNVSTTPGFLHINWHFTPRSRGTLQFVITYDLIGALEVYPEATPPRQHIEFTPIPGELTTEAHVQRADFRIHLPMPTSPSSITIDADGLSRTTPQSHTLDGQTFAFSRTDFGSGEEWSFSLQTDAVALSAAVPDWQGALDEQPKTQSLMAGLAGLAMLVTLVFGGLGIFLIWYHHGRDPHAAIVPPFLAEPPGDTPPAIIGVLIDERADDRDIAATFTDWSRRGVISITNRKRTGPTMTLLQVPDNCTEFERSLMRCVFPSQGYTNPVFAKHKTGQTGVSMAYVRDAIRLHRGELQRALYNEVTSRGWFDDSPETIRKQWKFRSTYVAVASLPVAMIAATVFSPWMLLPTLTITGLSLALGLLSPALPKRTQSGIEEVARWRAFEQYLRDLRRYDSIETARSRFSEFLPYGIIFGLEAQLIQLTQLAEQAQPAMLHGSYELPFDWMPNVHLGNLPDLSGLMDFSFLSGLSPSDLQGLSDAAAYGLEGAGEVAGELLEFIGEILVAVIGGLSD